MIIQLRQKPGGGDIEVVQGDMTSVDVGKTYALGFLVFNTIMNLTSQKGQVECFRNAARHLKAGGKFVVEVMVPDLRLYPPSAKGVVSDISPSHLGVNTYGIAEQKLVSHHVNIYEDGHARYNTLPFRYVWPSELDLMAQIAGMNLVSRHEDWIGTPFGDNSSQHVSVWEKI